MLLVRCISSISMALVITALCSLVAPLMSSRREAVVMTPVKPVQIMPLPESLPKPKKKVVKPAPLKKLPRTPKKPLPRQPVPQKVAMAMHPLKIEMPQLRASKLPAPLPETPARGIGGFGTGEILEAGAVDTPPRLQKYTRPAYPAAARGKRLEGRVIIRCIVTARGRVKALRVTSSSPEGYFESAALKAVMKWTFVPAQLRGEKVPVYVDIPLTFSLE